MISGQLDLTIGIFEICLLFLAFFVGWIGGRAYQRSSYRANDQNLPLKEYYKGINLLLNERPDQAVDVFLKSFEVTRETVETYLALGGLFRRRGESARAIKIHQHLLAKTDLNRPQQEMIQLELARDYFHAGLFDRAQGLLNELIELGGRHRRSALSLLIQIHEQFKEWPECERLGMMLLKAGDETMLVKIAHYMCETVEVMLEVEAFTEAKQKLKLAAQYDKRSVRVLMLQARVYEKTGEARDALRCLKRALNYNTSIFLDIDGLLKSVLQSLESDEYPSILLHALEASPRVELVEAFADWTLEQDGREAKQAFVESYISRYPYWKLFLFLIGESQQESSKENWLLALQDKINCKLAKQSVFQCEQCGFESQQLIWRCPSCRSWGKIHRISEDASNAWLQFSGPEQAKNIAEKSQGKNES